MNAEHFDEFIKKLQERFEKNMQRHNGLDWISVQKKLEQNEDKVRVLLAMESSGGEPDIVAYDENANEYIFCDCSAESPIGRRSLCYDRKALDSRKENKPVNSVIDLAESIGIELLTEEQYRDLQKLGEFDKKTSSWIKTPDKIRSLGGALFCDRRYDHVFVYHNGADSYYSSRGFRGIVRL